MAADAVSTNSWIESSGFKRRTVKSFAGRYRSTARLFTDLTPRWRWQHRPRACVSTPSTSAPGSLPQATDWGLVARIPRLARDCFLDRAWIGARRAGGEAASQYRFRRDQGRPPLGAGAL